MEFIGYIVVYVSCTLLKKVNLIGGKTTISEFVSSTAGGAVEEMMESIVQWIFPDGSFFFSRNMKAKRRLAEKLQEYIVNLTPRERSEIENFLNRLDLSKVSIPELKSLSKLIEGDFSDYLKGIGSSGKRAADKEIKAFRNAVKSALTSSYKRIDDEQNKSLYDNSIDIIVKDLFGVDWNSIPVSVQNMFKLFNDQVYELKYLRLSSNDQDLVKIVQQMIDDGNAALIKTLKPSFNYMDQVSSMAGTSFTEVRIDSIAKTNPYCYFRLECPNCGASGRNVYKDSENNVHCRKCGETFSIMRSVQDDEIKQKIDAAYNGISIVRQNLCEAKESTNNELRDLAEKIVEVEYFEAFKESITESINDQGLEISLTVEKFVHESEEGIKEKIDEVVNILRENNNRNVITADELSQNIKTAIASLNEENKKLQEDMYNYMQQHSRDIGEVKTMVTMMVPMMVRQMNNIDKLQKTFDFLKTVSNVSAAENHTVERVCPHCRRLANFERRPDEKYYVCQYCNRYIDMDDMNDPYIQADALEIEIKEYCNAYFSFNDIGSNIGKNNKIARIYLSPAVANCLNEQNGCLLTNSHLLSQTETVIIFGNVNLNARALQKIVGYNNNIRVLVLGEGTGLAIEGDASAWQPHFADGSIWKYEKDLYKLSRKNI